MVNTERKRKRNLNKTLKKINHRSREKENKKGSERNYKNSQKTVNKIVRSTYLSIISVNVNELNSIIKRYMIKRSG